MAFRLDGGNVSCVFIQTTWQNNQTRSQDFYSQGTFYGYSTGSPFRTMFEAFFPRSEWLMTNWWIDLIACLCVEKGKEKNSTHTVCLCHSQARQEKMQCSAKCPQQPANRKCCTKSEYCQLQDASQPATLLPVSLIPPAPQSSTTWRSPVSSEEVTFSSLLPLIFYHVPPSCCGHFWLSFFGSITT